MSEVPSPTFSVIILNWNGQHLLGACLHSLRQQSFRDFEVILVDNGSSDDSLDFVCREFPEVRVLDLKANLGFSAGNNRGVSVARGRYILFLNNDTESHPLMLEELCEAIQKDSPEVGSWAIKMMSWDKRQVIDNCGSGYSAFGTGFQIGAGQIDGEEFSKPRWVFGASGGGGCYRKSVLDDIGLFDEDFFFNNEDVDLSFRAQLAGYRCRFVPEAQVFHRGSATGGAMSDFTVYHIHRNKEWVFFKNMPTPLLWKYLPLHCLYSVAWILYWTLHGKARVVLVAKWDALLGWRDVRRKRRHIQSQRRIDLHYLDSMINKNRILRVWRSRSLSVPLRQGKDGIHP